MEKTYTYDFQTSQPLTAAQLKWMNTQLLENLFSADEDIEDIPEWVSEIELQREG
jgi:hypothetical protein